MKTEGTKAISPIFATLIILAIVTVLFIPVFMWSTGMTGETEEFWELSGQEATERIVLEEVNLNGGEPDCTVYVRNIGKTAVTVDNIIITSSDNSVYVYVSSDIASSPASVVQGNLLTLTLDLSVRGLTPVGGEVYTVKAFTTRGVDDVYQLVA